MHGGLPTCTSQARETMWTLKTKMITISVPEFPTYLGLIRDTWGIPEYVWRLLGLKRHYWFHALVECR